MTRVLKVPDRHAMPPPNHRRQHTTGEGLAETLNNTDILVDVSDSPSFEREAAIAFFETATDSLLAAEKNVGVKHHIALSAVGTDELAPESRYFCAKQVQQQVIAKGAVPYSIVHAAQIFEFIEGIVDSETDGDTVRLTPVYFQPIASADVAKPLPARRWVIRSTA